ncbi:hypothetical protein AOQ84DRAFT_370777 [Glonium stellatum]|uniref:Rhodopsin domain-containing protein n=1 Tax=Glonium stellatum TaxID=574774 RepID=A0A8E2FEW7_9PEZI|nr:hypothetical protein AOQ84DRAFT_370777 [Glonium stellatum]
MVAVRLVPAAPNISKGPKLLVVNTTMFAVAILLFIGRIYTRLRPVPRLGLDDYTLSVAVIFSIASWCLVIITIVKGFGRHVIYVSPSTLAEILELGFLVEPLWLWSVTLIKTSMACTLLRFKTTKVWQRSLCAIIFIQVITAISGNIARFIQCHPIRTFWDPTLINAKCWNPNQIQIAMYIHSGIFIGSDVILSLLPITFLRKLRIPLRERIILIFLMALGLFASVASIMRTILTKYYLSTDDVLWDMADLTMWSHLEEYVGIIAVCIPCLKSPFEKILRQAGIQTTKTDSEYNEDTVQLHIVDSGGVQLKKAPKQDRELEKGSTMPNQIDPLPTL